MNISFNNDNNQFNLGANYNQIKANNNAKKNTNILIAKNTISIGRDFNSAVLGEGLGKVFDSNNLNLKGPEETTQTVKTGGFWGNVADKIDKLLETL